MRPASLRIFRCCDTVDWASGIWLDQFAAHARLAGEQDAEDAHPGRVGDGPRQFGQFLVGRRGVGHLTGLGHRRNAATGIGGLLLACRHGALLSFIYDRL